MKRTKLEQTIALLKRRYTTALESAQQGGAISLSQRVTRDIEPVYVVRRRWVTTRSGSRVLAYRIVKKLDLRPGK